MTITSILTSGKLYRMTKSRALGRSLEQWLARPYNKGTILMFVGVERKKHCAPVKDAEWIHWFLDLDGKKVFVWSRNSEITLSHYESWLEEASAS